MIRTALYGLLYACLIAVAAVFQGRLHCDLALVLTMFAAYRWGLTGGALAGFWSGLVVGSLCGNLAGPLATAYVGVGWWAHMLFTGSGGRSPLALLGKTVILACGLLGLELTMLSALGVPPSFDLDSLGLAIVLQALAFLVMAVVAELVPALAPELQD